MAFLLIDIVNVSSVDLFVIIIYLIVLLLQQLAMPILGMYLQT